MAKWYVSENYRPENGVGLGVWAGVIAKHSDLTKEQRNQMAYVGDWDYSQISYRPFERAVSEAWRAKFAKRAV